MKNKTKVITVSAITLCLLAGGFGLVKAAYGPNDSSMGEIVSNIAKRFNLNQGEVQAVFNEHRAQMEAQKGTRRAENQTKAQERFTERINQAVAEGRLTQAQANAITAKRTELQNQTGDFQNMTPEQRRIAAQERMKSMKQWMTDNNIPQEFCPMGMGTGSGMNKGMRGGQGRGGR